MLSQQRNMCTDCKSALYTAQLDGTPHHSSKLHPGLCSSVARQQGTDTQTHTEMVMTNIHFASSTTHAKCNNCKTPVPFPDIRTGYNVTFCENLHIVNTSIQYLLQDNSMSNVCGNVHNNTQNTALFAH